MGVLSPFFRTVLAPVNLALTDRSPKVIPRTVHLQEFQLLATAQMGFLRVDFAQFGPSGLPNVPPSVLVLNLTTVHLVTDVTTGLKKRDTIIISLLQTSPGLCDLHSMDA